MVKVSIEPKSQADFLAAIQKYAQRSKQTLKDATLEQAALACKDAAVFTPPLAKGGGKGLDVAAQKPAKRPLTEMSARWSSARLAGQRTARRLA